MAVDPGQTTGVATALIDATQPTVASAIRRSHRKGLLSTHELKGPWHEQAWELARFYFDWMFQVHIERCLVASGHCLYVAEGFEIRTMAADVTPIRINSGFEVLVRQAFDGWQTGSLAHPDEIYDSEYDKVVSLQPPSEKGFCNDVMLRDWGLRRKSPHENDALRHLARRVDRILNGDIPS